MILLMVIEIYSVIIVNNYNRIRKYQNDYIQKGFIDRYTFARTSVHICIRSKATITITIFIVSSREGRKRESDRICAK